MINSSRTGAVAPRFLMRYAAMPITKNGTCSTLSSVPARQERRPQTRHARDDKVHRSAGAIQGHEDHESADAEEELDAEETEGQFDGGRRQTWKELGVAHRVVIEHHRHGREAPQNIEFEDPLAPAALGCAHVRSNRLGGLKPPDDWVQQTLCPAVG